MKIKGVKKMVCRDAYTRAINYWAGSPDFKGGNKLQLSVDYLSAYPLLPLHYPCSLLFYYKGVLYPMRGSV